MYSRNSFGSYYPVDSTIHKLNPVIKVINFIIAMILIMLSGSIYINSFILIFVIIMIFLSYVPFRFYFNTFYSLRYIYLILAFICAYFNQSIISYFVYFEKIIIVSLYLNIISFTTSPSENIYGIEKFLSLFNVFYLKVGVLSTKIDSLIRYFPLYLTVKYKTLKAASSRGIKFNKYNIFKRISMFFKLKRKTNIKNKEIENYAKLRLYDINNYRTNYRTNKPGLYDIFFLLFHIILVFAYLIEEGIL